MTVIPELSRRRRLLALFALCGFGAFLLLTTQYLQDVRGLPALATGLCLLPVGALVVVLSPAAGRRVAKRSPGPSRAPAWHAAGSRSPAPSTACGGW
jgi:hypothetical protein